MKRIYSLASLILFFLMFFGCQTLKVQEPEAPPGPVGVYLGKTSTPNGEIEFTLTINADGTGSTESTMGKSEFKDAMIEGNNFAFGMIVNTQMGEMEIAIMGSVEGDNISGTIATQMGEMPFAGQRM